MGKVLIFHAQGPELKPQNPYKWLKPNVVAKACNPMLRGGGRKLHGVYPASERPCFIKTESTCPLTPKNDLWPLHRWVGVHAHRYPYKGIGLSLCHRIFKKKTIMKQN